MAAVAASAAPLLAVSALNAWYGESHILHGVDFDIAEGEVVTLLGRNGAGKTTTLKSIMGMVDHRQGSIRFGAAEIVGLPPREPRPRTRFEAWLDADSLSPNVVVRSRRPGDRIRPLGLGGEKKVQDLFVDAKVPREERDALPMVCAPWGIAWVVGLRIDERAALREGSRSAVRLNFRRARRNR